jgi:RNA polymerase primary sigma factor
MTATGPSWWLEQIGRYPLLTPAQELTYGRQVQEWRTHPDGPDGCPPDVRRRGLRARERFVRANLRLVVTVAKRFRRMVPGEAFDDLIQAGNHGLIEAVERFDPSRGYRFSTYATYWVQMRVTCHLERSERTIRLPTTISPKVGAIPRTLRKLFVHLGREPTREDLAQALGMSVMELDRIATVGRQCASLDCPVGTEDGLTTLGQMLPSPAPPPLPEDIERLQRQIQRLPERSRLVLEAAYGIGRGVATMAEFAREQRITRGAAQQLLEQALKSLRGTMDPSVVQLGLQLQAIACPGDHDQAGGATSPMQRRRQRREPAPQLSLPLPRRILNPSRRRAPRGPSRSGKLRAG